MNIEINDLLVNDVVNRFCMMLEKAGSEKRENQATVNTRDKVIDAIKLIAEMAINAFQQNKDAKIEELEEKLEKANKAIDDAYTILSSPEIYSTNPEFDKHLSKLKEMNKKFGSANVETESEEKTEEPTTTTKKKK